MSQSDAEDQKRDVLIFEFIKKRFDDERKRTNNLDGKAGNLVGFVSVVVGLLLGGGSVLSGGNMFSLSQLLSHPFAAHGTLSNVDQDTGVVTYNPNSGFTGTDKFTFKVNDGKVDSSNIGTVNIRVGGG